MLGDYRASNVIDLLFSTRNGGVMTTLAGSPVISVYKANSLTQSTSGVTLDVDFDSITGLNHVRIDTSSDGTFYAEPNCFNVVITTGTVASVSVVGVQVENFTLGFGAAYVALKTDTYAEPGQAAPPATTTLVSKIGYLYKFMRNRKTQTATTLSVYADDATTVDQKATISDNGTTYDHGEIASGP